MLTTVLLKKPQTIPPQSILDEAIPFNNFVKNLIQNNVASSSDPVGQNYCVAPSVIESQIPFWIKQNYGTDSNENYLIAFLKSYYNWMYCGFKKQDVQLTPYDIEELLDVDRVPDAFLDEYIKSYAPFISLPSISATDKQYVRAFIRSIKSDFLITKGTEPAYRYLLKTLYNVTNVNIDYPKKYLMRLNGGKYVDFSWDLVPNDIIDLPQNFDPNNPIQNDVLAGNVGYDTQNRPNLFGAALNESVLPDDYFWQEYSYILTSDADPTQALTYKDTVLAGTHPAGMLGFFEQYVPLDDIDTGTDNTGDSSVPAVTTELPRIQSYLLYGLTMSSNTDLIGPYIVPPPCGNTPNGYLCYCCNNNCDPEGSNSRFPEHSWVASWDKEISSGFLNYTYGDGINPPTIADIPIGDFLELARASWSRPNLPYQPSPNAPLSTCSAIATDCALCVGD
jgi:hypothetical protein